jgi:GT2 family glycosyltransferase
MNSSDPKVSVIIVSYNTKSLLSRCIDSALKSAAGLPCQVIVVDNGSKDDSADYLRREFPAVELIESAENLGFAAANNLGCARARGEYLVLLNSDAFLVGDSLAVSVGLMDGHPEVGLAGGRLVGEDGSWQPSARSFPSLWNDFLTLSGLAGRHRASRVFGRPDMTYADQHRDLLCDWVPGAFTIIRRRALDSAPLFDERFFLYYEEVDLCLRIKRSGWAVAYWPAIKAIHLGGASTALFSQKLVTKSGRQMGLWRLQSQYLYYRKNHGAAMAFASMALESTFNRLRLLRNSGRSPEKVAESRAMLVLIARAWSHTKGGRESPPRPWKGD